MSRVTGDQDLFVLKTAMSFAIVVTPGLTKTVMSAEENTPDQSEHWQSSNQNQSVAFRGLMMAVSTWVIRQESTRCESHLAFAEFGSKFVRNKARPNASHTNAETSEVGSRSFVAIT